MSEEKASQKRGFFAPEDSLPSPRFGRLLQAVL